jgi:NitT/TauT family transport system substrate-binding protein
MQDRRYFLKTGISVAAASLAGAAGLVGVRRTLAEEAPPETTSLRLPRYPATCLAPLDILDDLLREEGFTEVSYLPDAETKTAELFERGEVDFTQDFSPVAILPIDAGAPIVMLAGVHPGCFELVAREPIRSVADLKGRKVGLPWAGDAQQVIVSIIVSNVGLDPAKDIDWVVHGPRNPKELLGTGEIDAFLTVPPWAQEARALRTGHVILNSTLDRP